MALTIFFLVGLAALAVDIGYVAVTKNELQNVADAAALAAARELGHGYEGLSYQQQQLLSADAAAIINVAQAVALENQAGGKNITVDAADVIIGDWNPTSKIVTPTLSHPDAVKVTAYRRTGTNGPVQMFFASIFGISTLPVSATATAALTGISEGKPIPVGISKRWFEQSPTYCNQRIKFYPTDTACTGTDYTGLAGWDTYTSQPANASKLKKILQDMQTGTQAPEVDAGETVYFTGGTVASAFQDMVDLFNYMKTRDDDGNPDTWTTEIIVYDSECGNPTGGIPILGFATVVIDNVTASPVKQISGYVICDNVEFGRGSGGPYGTLSSIPGLVQ